MLRPCRIQTPKHKICWPPSTGRVGQQVYIPRALQELRSVSRAKPGKPNKPNSPRRPKPKKGSTTTPPKPHSTRPSSPDCPYIFSPTQPLPAQPLGCISFHLSSLFVNSIDRPSSRPLHTSIKMSNEQTYVIHPIFSILPLYTPLPLHNFFVAPHPERSG